MDTRRVANGCSCNLNILILCYGRPTAFAATDATHVDRAPIARTQGRVARQASQADSGSPTMPSLSTRASTQVPASSQPSANFSRNGRHAKAQAGGGSFTAERVGSDVRAASGSTIAGLLTNGWLRLVQLDSRKRHEKRKGRWDELKLWAMGYKQELNRGFTLLNNFAVAQALMSCFVIVGESHVGAALRSKGALHGRANTAATLNRPSRHEQKRTSNAKRAALRCAGWVGP